MNVRKSNYDKEPFIKINGFDGQAWNGYAAIIFEVRRKLKELSKSKAVVAIDCYPGADEEEIFHEFAEGLEPDLVIKAKDATYDNETVEAMLKRNITDDRVFGVLSCHVMDEFFDKSKLDSIRNKIRSLQIGTVFVIGTGAALIEKPDILIYADMARWEIQLRMRRGEIGNWCADNKKEELLRKYKRAFFIDWRVADRHKADLFDNMDYLLDTNKKNAPKMISGKALLGGMNQAVTQPFRLVPFFDPGPWGGQWMKQVCGLQKDTENYAWCFDCVPEENSLYLKYGDVRVEIPAINLVLYKPVELLGDTVHARFGKEFPIRFDFLDTMEGGNLSLQVHPLTEYIQQTFGMHYTQDESYYLLDAGEDAVVYLGLKEKIDKEKMCIDLEEAQKGSVSFDAEKYINKWTAKKHDHFLIPAGTIHCSGRNAMVLEISATPYIFTFKLWDWDRLGLDGRPRPIHLEHGKKVIEWSRDTEWVKKNLVNRVERICEGDGWIEEKTGLHEREFIETRRHWFTKPVLHNTQGGVNVLNMVEGEKAIITSPTNAFEPFIVNYAETFVIPAFVGAYIISPYGTGNEKPTGTIKAFVRG